MAAKILMLVLLLAVVSLTFAAPVPINHHEHGRQIFLHNRQLDTTATPAHENFESEQFGLFYMNFKPRFTSVPANLVELATQYGVTFDDYLPPATYFLYAPTTVVGKIAEDNRVVWVGAVPFVDKLSFNVSVPTETNVFTFHFARCAGCPTLEEEVASLTERMNVEFGAASFSWNSLVPTQMTARLALAAEAEAEQYVLWLLKKGTQRIRFVEAVPLIASHSSFESHTIADGSYNGTGCGGGLCTYPLSVAPLTGANQIIALCDTGLDHNNCFFQDPAVPFSSILNEVDLNARKIVSYIDVLGDQIDNNGHGSFVAGVAAGAAGGSASSGQVNAVASFNGLATDAKLVVMDVLPAGSNSLNIPANIESELLSFMYGAHGSSRIGLFPWGSTITLAGSKSYYSNQDAQFDNFINTNRDFFATASAGNYGFNGVGRVTSPATAKNVLGVGGSLNSHDAFTFSNYMPNLQQIGNDQFVKYCTIGETSAYNDIVFCNQVGRSAPCPDYQLVLCPPIGQFDGTADACCSIGYFRPICCPSVIANFWAASSLIYSEHSVFPLSSRGPAFDYRIKPDVLAPAGRLYGPNVDSSATGPYCGSWVDAIPGASQSVTVNEGTSGSAGLVAGAAALVRQWLREGYWPAGDPSNPNSFPYNRADQPTASLIRSLLISSTEPLAILNTNGNAFYETISHTRYSGIQGFGRINLKNILATPTNPTNNVYLISDISIPQSNFSQTYCLSVISGASYVRITAAWTDPAASVNAGVSLVNNIDILLVREDGFEYRANGLTIFDSVNNVEDIYITSPPAGSYSLKVYGTHITSPGGQLVDIVLRGDFNCPNFLCLQTAGACQPILRICPMDCSLRGACQAGTCICSSPYYGIDCSLSPCPNDCNGNGRCNGETGICECNDFYKGLDCSTNDPTGTSSGCNTIVVTEDCSDRGVDKGIVIGVTIGAFFLGALIFFILGAWLAMQTMLRRKKKMIAKYRQMKAHEGGTKPLQVQPDDDE